MSIHLGSRGAAIIKDTEKLRLKAYKPTPNDVWTVGWGSTRGVHEGMTITLAEAEQRFITDTADAVRAVDLLARKLATLSPPVPLTQSMVDALISLVYNAGSGAILSTATIGRALLAGDYYSAWAGFALWRKQKGIDLLGLARRRAREMTLFLEDGVPR